MINKKNLSVGKKAIANRKENEKIAELYRLELIEKAYGKYSPIYAEELLKAIKTPLFNEPKSYTDEELTDIFEGMEYAKKLEEKNQRYCITLVKLKTDISL